MSKEDDELEVEEGAEEGQFVDVEDSSSKKEEGSAKVQAKEEVSIAERQEENEELSGAESDDEREEIRARRRAERQHRKKVGKEREQAKDRLVASLQMQVQDLNEKLSHVGKRQSDTDFARLDEELNQAVSTANEAKHHLQSAAEASDGVGVAEATELYYTARRRAEYLANVKQKVTKGAGQTEPQLDQRIVHNASEWMRKNSWYSHASEDDDSVETKRIDNQLVREGYDPRTKEYWEELSDRVSDKLPHRFGKVKNTSKNTSPPVGGSDKNSGGASNGGSNKFFLSAGRVQAIKDSGLWDDPEARAKMIKSYRDYDKEHSKDKK